LEPGGTDGSLPPFQERSGTLIGPLTDPNSSIAFHGHDSPHSAAAKDAESQTAKVLIRIKIYGFYAPGKTNVLRVPPLPVSAL